MSDSNTNTFTELGDIDPLLEYKQAVCSQLGKLVGVESELLIPMLEELRDKKKGDLALHMAKINKVKKLPGKPDVFAADFASKMETNSMITKVEPSGPYINIFLNAHGILVKAIHQVCQFKDSFGGMKQENPQTIVVEYSSPNIAKPFHAGHLRSTIIGNFIKNVHCLLGYKVLSINYLGDWGKQYGMLAVGFEKFGSEEELLKDPIRHLFDVYVKINKEAKEDDSINQQARAVFKKMEDGEPEALALWKRFRELSIAEYKKVYHRLGIEYDVYSGESQQSEGMKTMLKLLEEKGLLTDDQGAKLIDLKEHKLGVVLVTKSDGTTLYVTRDIAAAVSRYEEYKFDKMFYVVAAQQDLHFKQLFKILDALGMKELSSKLHHVNFGMVKGMSTRTGNVVFLEDILNSAMQENLTKMKSNEAKFAEVENPEKTADILGLSAVFIQDMSAHRIRDYDFSWDRMLEYEGHTGPYLQFAHARLCGVEEKAGVAINENAKLELLVEKEALDLGLAISRFPKAVQLASQSLEANGLVTYLFDLSHAVSVAHSVLWVKDREKDLAEARMLLFWAAKTTLANGMKILGLQPLQRM